MAAYYQVYDSCHLQAGYQEPGSAPEPYAWQSSMGYLFTTHSSGSTLQQLETWTPSNVVPWVHMGSTPKTNSLVVQPISAGSTHVQNTLTRHKQMHRSQNVQHQQQHGPHL